MDYHDKHPFDSLRSYQDGVEAIVMSPGSTHGYARKGAEICFVDAYTTTLDHQLYYELKEIRDRTCHEGSRYTLIRVDRIEPDEKKL